MSQHTTIFHRLKYTLLNKQFFSFNKHFLSVSYVLVFTQNTTPVNSVAECEPDGLPSSLSTLLGSRILTPSISLREECFERGKKKVRDRHACSLGESFYLFLKSLRHPYLSFHIT